VICIEKALRESMSKKMAIGYYFIMDGRIFEAQTIRSIIESRIKSINTRVRILNELTSQTLTDAADENSQTN
jgi:hypothetical protein